MPQAKGRAKHDAPVRAYMLISKKQLGRAIQSKGWANVFLYESAHRAKLLAQVDSSEMEPVQVEVVFL